MENPKQWFKDTTIITKAYPSNTMSAPKASPPGLYVVNKNRGIKVMNKSHGKGGLIFMVSYCVVPKKYYLHRQGVFTH